MATKEINRLENSRHHHAPNSWGKKFLALIELLGFTHIRRLRVSHPIVVNSYYYAGLILGIKSAK